MSDHLDHLDHLDHFHRGLERAFARRANQATQTKQADLHKPASIITPVVTSKRMTDEEYQVVIISKMKSHIQQKLKATDSQ
ncbi:hypothetical protein [Pseudomonas petrae]|uniref:Uncharacterized protein n=1 Tax=Pseudomonas petrae TaxID=2912190 RepID=A0ABS9ID88_9PSED|nr:hypothetical protein [Pseudomonas petrae]MCF7545693.1 hypothetical protein [Pseudomonas petrae]